jgi:hypothetical protein
MPLRALLRRPAPDLASVIDQGWEELETLCGFGPFHRELPRPLRKRAVVEAVPSTLFREWLAGLEEVARLDPEQEAILGSAG